MRSKSLIYLLISEVFLLGASAWGQTVGGISGTVKDQTGAALPALQKLSVVLVKMSWFVCGTAVLKVAKMPSVWDQKIHYDRRGYCAYSTSMFWAS